MDLPRVRRSTCAKRLTQAVRRAVRPVIEQLEQRQLLAAGDLDPTFGNGGIVFATGETSTYNELRDTALQSDGKIVAVGDNNGDIIVARYTAAGITDPTFGNGGRVTVHFSGYESATDVEVDSGGKIVVVGVDSTNDARFVLRFNADGSPDASFGAQGVLRLDDAGSISDLEIAPGGKLIISGSDNVSSGSQFAVWRLNADGSGDNTFDRDGYATFRVGSGDSSVTQSVYALAVQPDGKILLAGNATQPQIGPRMTLLRVREDGSVDAGFGAQGVVYTTHEVAPSGVTVAPDGKIVVATHRASNQFGGVTLSRFNPDGSPDASFDGDGTFVWSGGFTPSFAGAVFVQSDGKIVIGTESGTFQLVRFNADGGLDNTFGWMGSAGLKVPTSISSTGPIQSILYNPADDSYIAGGTVVFPSSVNWNRGDFFLGKLGAASGSIYQSFGGTTDFSGRTEDYASAMLVQPDGKIVVAGRGDTTSFRFTSPTPAVWTVARQNPDGTPDGSFGNGGVSLIRFDVESSLFLNAVRLQPDGKILLVGEKRVGSNDHNFVAARLNADGTPDTSFDGDGKLVLDGSINSDEAHDVLVQDDGKLVLVGFASGFALVRLNPNGSIDTSFGSGGRMAVPLSDGGTPYVAVSQPDDKFLIAGDGGIARYNANWTLDTRFDGDGLLPLDRSIRDLAIDSQGRIVLLEMLDSGRWATYALTRLRPNGTIDTSFGNAGTFNLNPTVGVETFLDIDVDARDRIVATATFGEWADTRVITMRVLSEGGVDAQFGSGGYVTALKQSSNYFAMSGAGAVAATADGKILVLGFALHDGTGTRDLALLRYDATNPLAAYAGETYAVQEGGSVTLSGTAISDASVAGFEWDLDDDGVFETAGAKVTFSAAAIDGPATRTVALRVTDADGQSHIDRATVEVRNAPAVVTVSGPARADFGMPYPLSLSYADSATAAGLPDTIASVTIDWGDGTVETIAGTPSLVTHDYPAGRASYRVLVTAADEDGTYQATYVIEGRDAPDAMFGNDGTIVPRAGGGRIFPLADGTFIHAADSTVTRYRADGSVDETFAAITLPASLHANAYAITPEGKLLVAGREIPSGSNLHGTFVARYDPTGAPDPTFGGGDGIVQLDVSGTGLDYNSLIGTLPDGNTLIVTSTDLEPQIAGGEDTVLMRLNPDGSVDTSFGRDGRVVTGVRGTAGGPTRVITAPSGRAFVSYGSFPVRAFRPDGSSDTSFGASGGISAGYQPDANFALDSLGNLLLIGTNGNDRLLARFTPLGEPDTTFGSNGSVTLTVPGYSSVPQYRDLVVDQRGGILLVGEIARPRTQVGGVTTDLVVTRVTGTGIDTSFGNGGSIVFDIGGDGAAEVGRAVTAIRDGRFLVIADSKSASTGIAQPLILRVGGGYHAVSMSNSVPNVSAEDTSVSPATPAEGQAFTLTGTVGDPDADDAHTVTIEWGDGSPNTVVQLPPGELAFAATHAYPEDSLTPNVPHPWPVKITVSDGLLQAEALRTITVVNAAPTANAGPDLVAKEHDLVRLTATGTDPGSTDAGALRYHWKVTGPLIYPGVSEMEFSTQVITFTPGQVGAYTATLTVIDPDGAFHSDSTTITVGDAVPQISLNGVPSPVPEGHTANIMPWHSIDIAWRRWTVTDYAGRSYHPADAPVVYVTAHDEGVHTVLVEYGDDEGNTNSTTLTMVAENVAPELPAFTSPFTGTEATPVKLTVNATDRGVRDTITYLWEILDAAHSVVASAASNTIEASLHSGMYTARVTVRDDDGAAATRQALLSVADVRPTLHLSGPTSVPEGSPYTLNLFASDPGDDTIAKWVIDWGDGSIETFDGNPSSVTHIYADGPNVFPITATATDEDGSYTVSTTTIVGNPLDPSFDNDGLASTQMNGAHDRVTGLAVQPDGKIIAVGRAGNPIRTGIVRYLPSGTRDTTFFSLGTLTNTFGDADVAILLDGTVAVAASSSNGGTTVVRLNPDTGSILSRTEVGTQAAAIPLWQIQIHALPDGRFYVAGRGGGGYTVARMTAAGAIDQTFGVRHTPLTGTNHQLHDIAIQPDGKVLLAGATQLADGYGAIFVRHNPDGTLDTAFGGGDGIVANPEGFYPSSILLMPDGRILAGHHGRLALFNTDGSQDMAFGTNGFRAIEGSNQSIVSILRDEAGRFILTTLRHEVLRLNPDFTTDTTFGTNGRASVALGASYSQTTTAALTPAGGLVIGGTTGTANVDTNFWIARLLMAQPPVTVTNVAPTITLSGDPTVADGDLYTLNLAATDPGTDTITSWTIDWGDGSDPQIITGNPSSVTHTFADGPGQYTITARVTDEDGAHPLGDTHNVYVTPPTQPFVFGNADVSLSAASIDEGGIVHLSGSFSDTRGVHGVTVDWGDGYAPSTRTLPRGVSTFTLSYHYLDEPAGDDGRYVITVVVHNGLESRSATTSVTVTNSAPTAAAGPDRYVTEGAPVTITAAATDPGTLDALSYRWEVIAPDGRTFPVGDALAYTFTPPDEGTYTLRFTASDDDGGEHTDTVVFNVAEVRPTLTARIDRTTVQEGTPFKLNLSSTDPGDDTIASWTIDWGNGSPVQVVPGNTSELTHAYPDGPLDLRIHVTATDEDGTYHVVVPGTRKAGTPDTTFGGTGQIKFDFPENGRAETNEMLLQPDGKALVLATLYAETVSPYHPVLLRYNPDGSPDTSFGDNGVVHLNGGALTNAAGLDLALAPGGEIVVLGALDYARDPILWRLDADGRPDTSFGPAGDGRATDPFPDTLATQVHVLENGKILIGGSSAGGRNLGGHSLLTAMRLNADGTPDATFGDAGRAVAVEVLIPSRDGTTDIAVTPDGKITLLGASAVFSFFDWSVARFKPDGSRDLSFGSDGWKYIHGDYASQIQPAGIAYQSDGRFIIVGAQRDGTNTGSATELLVRRFNDDGSPDTTYGVDGSLVLPAGSGATFIPTSVFLDDAHRAYVAGYADNAMAVLRITPDGKFDTSFGPGAFGMATTRLADSVGERADDVVVDAEGRVWLAGVTAAPHFGGVPVPTRVTLARLLPDVVRVENAAPRVSIPIPTYGHFAERPVTVGMNMPLTRPGSFTDPGDDTWTATVNYGDGTPVQPLTLNPDKTFNLEHTYASAGRYAIAVTVTDSDGAKGSRSFGVDVRDATLRGSQLSDNFDVRLTPDGDFVEFFENAPLTGAPTFTLPLASAGTIKLQLPFGNDRLTIHSGTFNLQAVGFGAPPSLANMQITLKGTSSATVLGNNQIRALDVLDDATFAIETGRKTLRVNRLTMSANGRLDVADGTLTVMLPDKPYATALAEVFPIIEALVRSARNSGPTGAWTGPGITSSAARANPLTGLATVATSPQQWWVTIKHTYNGDANLDGKVNADDYFAIDSAFLAQPQSPTYAQGNFNYDGTINADDYFLIDSAFLGQGAVAASAAPVSASPASTSIAPSAGDIDSESERRRRKRPVRASLFSELPITRGRRAT